MQGSKKNKVVVIGLDGATWDLILPWVKQGKLPTIKRLLEEGSHGVLESTFPPYTCPAWFSFSTGKNPGKIGVFNFIEMKKGAYEIEVRDNEAMFDQKEIWDILGSKGLRSFVINNPVAYPPKKIKGIMVAGLLAPSEESNYTHPKSLKKKLDKIADGYILDFYYGGDNEELRKKSLRIMEKRKKIFAHYLEERKFDFFLGIFSGTDRMSHQFLSLGVKGLKILQEFFTVLDEHLEEIVGLLREDDYLLLISDHGFGRVKEGFYINQWLIREGYLALKGIERSKIPLWYKLGFSKAHMGRILKIFGLRKFVLRRFPKIVQAVPEDQKFGEGPSIVDLINKGKIDWKRTKAISSSLGVIEINTEDKPKGVVGLGRELEKFKAEIKKKLEELGREKGLRIKIYKPEELYRGKFVRKAPDLQFEIEGREVEPISNIPYDDRLYQKFKKGYKFANHRQNGIFLIKGPGIKKKYKMKKAKIEDVMPTVLRLYEIQSPRDIDGRILTEVFES